MIKKILNKYESILPDILSGLIVEAVLLFIGWLLKSIDIWISIIVIIGGTAWVGFGYIAFKHRVVVGKGRKKGKKIRQWLYPQQRKYSVIGFILIPLVAIGWFGYKDYTQKLPPDKILVLIATFDGPDQENYRVTETILSNIKLALDNYDDVEIRPLGRVITEGDGSTLAREIGAQEKATILIWGWYGVTKEIVPLSVHVEFFLPSNAQRLFHLNSEEDTSGVVTPQNIKDLESFTLQTKLSNKMTFLSHYTVGIIRYSKNEYDEAIESFNKALQQSDESLTNENQSVLYRVIGDVYNDSGRSFLAIPYYDKAIQYNPTWSVLYNNRGFAYARLEQHERALQDYDYAIKLEPTKDFYFYNRAVARFMINDYDGAISDCNIAIELDSTEYRSYVTCGTLHFQLGDTETGIAYYRKAIELTDDPDLRRRLIETVAQAEKLKP